MIVQIEFLKSACLKEVLTLGFLFLLFPAFGQENAVLEQQESFLQLFDKEVQNRAFALLSMSAISEKVTEDGDKVFYQGWVAFEEFLQKKYKPYADKHGLSQEPRSIARTQAFFGKLASDVLPKKKFYKTMLNQTEDYLEELKMLPEYAAKEDLDFARFVVAQEEAQIEAIKHRIKGENQEAADVLADFVKSHQ